MPQERAKELGIEFTEETSEEELKNLISEKEEELESDLEYLRKERDKYKTEAKNAFDKRDRFKKDKDTLSTRVKELEGKLKNMVSSDEKTQLEEELADLRKFKDDYEKEKEKKELANKTELEREQLEHKKTKTKFQEQFDSFQQQLNDLKKTNDEEKQKSKEEIKRLRTNVLKADIIEISSKLNAWSPSQIFKLTKDDFTYDDTIDEYRFQKRNSSGKLEEEKTVEEYLTDFLKDPMNENLIKSNANNKGFDTKHTQTKDKKDKDLKSSKEFDPKDERIKLDAQKYGMDVEEYISRVLIPHREKFNKRYKKD